jgi:site-specific DNA recombinase
VAYRYDNDISASIFSNKPRLGYDDILRFIRANLADVLLATETSRLFRRVADVLEFLSITEGTTLRWIETTDRHVYDLRTAHGVHSLIASINDADFEVRKNSERVKRTRREEAKAGKYHGGNRPCGYEGAVRGICDVPDCTDKQNCKHGLILNRGRIGIVLVPPEAAIIRECVARLLAGWPIHSIVRDLSTRAVPATNGGPWPPTNSRRS